MAIAGKTAIITGSTSGIGLGIAQMLATQGARIVLNGLGDAIEIQRIQDDIARDHGVEVTYSAADMTRPAEIRDMVAMATERFGGVDILVNNAGIQHTAEVQDFPDERWDSVIAINLSSAFHATKAALPHMQAKSWGRIINIVSAHGLVGSASKVAYVSAKHGMIGMTKVVALENANRGITCVAVCPGWVLTPLVQKQIDARAAANHVSVEEEAAKLLGEKQPMHKFTTPDQLGKLVTFLCSDAASTVTGTSFSMDGGWTAQ